ncbi:MAG: hypothetical protein ACLRWH_03900 [Emergencia sp.]
MSEDSRINRFPRELIAEVGDRKIRAVGKTPRSRDIRWIIRKIAALASDKCTYGFEYNIKTIAKAPAVVLLTIVEGRSGFEKTAVFLRRRGQMAEF